MSIKMENIFDEIDGFRCHVCTLTFSINPASSLAPASVYCGHYVCMACHGKLIKQIPDDVWEYVCCLCQNKFNGNRPVEVAKCYIEFIRSMRRSALERETESKEDKMTFQEFIKNFSVMHCQSCDSSFSTDINGENPPAGGFCGHFWCISCDLKKRVSDNAEVKKCDMICLKCERCTAAFYPHKATKFSYGFMGTLSDLFEKLKTYWQQKYGFIDCSNCKNEIGVDDAAVCQSCDKTNAEDNDTEQIQRKISPLCMTCLLDFHVGPDHQSETYAKQRCLQEYSSSKVTLKSLKTEQNYIKKAHNDSASKLDAIERHLDLAHAYVENCKSSGVCSILVSELGGEMDDIKKEMLECTTSVLKYNSRLTELSSRLIEVSAKLAQVKRN